MIELKNVPKKIYLQMTETEMFGDFLEHDVTWSEDRINDSDIEYVRVQPDPVKAQMLEDQLAVCQMHVLYLILSGGGMDIETAINQLSLNSEKFEKLARSEGLTWIADKIRQAIEAAEKEEI